MGKDTGCCGSARSVGYTGPGVIRPEELYTIAELKNRLGVTNSTLRAARRSGLRVYYKHKHAYVYGRDWIEYVILSQDRKDA